MNWIESEENTAKKLFLRLLSTDTHSAYPEEVAVPQCRYWFCELNFDPQNWIRRRRHACDIPMSVTQIPQKT